MVKFFWELLVNNKEWFFSGAGFIVIPFLWKEIKHLFSRKEKYCVFNMHGIHFQADVKSCGLRKLNKKSQVEEYVVDFVSYFDKSGAISVTDNKRICDTIVSKCLDFKSRFQSHDKTYFTGMSPIPYEVYAGTFFNGSNVNRYLEYDSKRTKMFYELESTNSNISKMLFGEEILHFTTSENLNENQELHVSIEVTSRINARDLLQFQNYSNVVFSLSENKDNLIRTMDQLSNLKNDVSTLLEEYGKKGYKRIHVTAAIPSCLAVEIGKEIAQLGNRLPEIIVYHYVHTNDIKYPFGLIVNGAKKGELYRVV